MKCKECDIVMDDIAPNIYYCANCETQLKSIPNKAIIKNKENHVFNVLFALAENNILMLLVLNVIVFMIFELLFLFAKIIFGFGLILGFFDLLISLSVSAFFFIGAYRLGIKKLNP